ncbi:hypothetical protein ES703_26777 [subsurface metagenome]
MAQYADIVEIVAPSEAVEGSIVNVTIKIRSLWDDYLQAAAKGVFDAEVFLDWEEYIIPPGGIHSFSGSFIMPNSDVTIHAFSYYKAVDGFWYWDDEAIKDVKLAEVFEGTISRKELKYDAITEPIPVR